jgi:hypothetical protein
MNMKRVLKEQKSRASQGNGKLLGKAELKGALDDLIRTFEDSNRKLEKLLAKANA